VSLPAGKPSGPPHRSGFDWPSLVRRYVWHEERTPYLVRAERLTARQARSELFVYGLLLATLASIVAVMSVMDRTGGALAAPGVALYGVAIALGAIALGAGGHPLAAWLCATAPLLVELGILSGALRPGMTTNERITFLTAGALWLAYALRIVRVARRLHGRD
jgi:hypothetical protein